MKHDKWTLIRNAHQLLTLHNQDSPRRAAALAHLGVIHDGAVLLRNGIIEKVGLARSVENTAEARNAIEINAAGRVVMPAFIDCHACIIPSPAYYTVPASESWRSVAARKVRTLPSSRLEAQADDLLKTMARHGTATVGALSGYGIDTTGELKILRALRGRNRQPLDVVSILHAMGYSSERQGLPWAGEDQLGLLKRRELASVAQVRCGTGGLTLADTATFLHMAQSAGFKVRLEMLPDHDPELVDAAVNRETLSISATTPFRSSEIESLSYSSTFVILLPALVDPSVSSPYARQLIDDGALVALGTGINPEVRATASMQTVMQLACERLGMSIEEAISAATINAAWALGLGLSTGSLAHGKSADLILLNASDYREIPLLAGTNLTHSLIKRGVVVFKEDFPGWPAPS